MIYSPWGMLLIGLFFFVPRFPLFAKLDQKDELPGLTKWLVAFERLNSSCFYLPAVALILAFVLIDEAVVNLLSRRESGPLWAWIWVGAVGFCGLFIAPLLFVAGLLLPVFRMSSTVE